MAGKDQNLPSREASLFKSIVKLYTLKQYKKGLKAADQVLKSYPNHGETLAMKGLILSCMEKKTEAYDFVRRGLKANLTSHVCWHTYGLLYKGDRNYTEAIKCYRNALRHDKENMQILRDLALLQVQMRDLDGYSETRSQILTLKPGQRNSWLALAMAAHLQGKNERALGILGSYEVTLNDEARTGFEYSETLLYKDMLLEESGKLEEALKHLASSEKLIVDKQTVLEQRASHLHKLGRYGEAEKILRNLIKQNPDNVQYHHSLIATRLHVDPRAVPATLVATSSDNEDEKVQSLGPLYKELAGAYPRCLAVRRLPLEFLRGDEFRTAISSYIRPDLRRGVPSLFIGLKSLYADPAKRAIMGDVFAATYDSLSKSANFPGEEQKEIPSTLLWACYLLAQHLDRVGDHAAALAHVSRAIEHTPTVIELYTLQAKVLKHAGDVQGAWAAYERAREMDLADRYLNTKATLYALRADKIDVAERTIALFTSKEGSDPQETLFDMQCMWYETECGRAYMRLRNYGRALKKLLAVDKHFADITEDQFDFHTYCLRKMTLRTYVKMLRLEDQIYGHKYFQNAAQSAVEAYLAVFDNPVSKEKDEDKYANLNEKEKKAQLKKDKQKADKLKAKQEKEKEKETEEKGAQHKKKESTKPPDTDPEGHTLISGDVLTEASKLLRTLLKFDPKNITNNILSFKVNLRRKKYLLAVQSLKRASLQDTTNPAVYASILQLSKAVSSLPSETNEVVAKVLKSTVSSLLGSHDRASYLAGMISSHPNSLAHLTVALEESEEKKGAIENLLKTISAPLPANTQLESAVVAREALRRFGTPEEVEKFTQSAHSRFPLASTFAPPPPPPSAETSSTESAPSTN